MWKSCSYNNTAVRIRFHIILAFEDYLLPSLNMFRGKGTRQKKKTIVQRKIMGSEAVWLIPTALMQYICLICFLYLLNKIFCYQLLLCMIFFYSYSLEINRSHDWLWRPHGNTFIMLRLILSATPIRFCPATLTRGMGHKKRQYRHETKKKNWFMRNMGTLMEWYLIPLKPRTSECLNVQDRWRDYLVSVGGSCRRKPQMLVSIPFIKLYHQFYHSHLEQRKEALSLAHMENGLASFPWAWGLGPWYDYVLCLVNNELRILLILNTINTQHSEH